MKKLYLLFLIELLSCMQLYAQYSPVPEVSAHHFEKTADSLMAQPLRKHPWLAAAAVTGINTGVHLYNRYIAKEEFAKTTLRTIRNNFKTGFVWDNDVFSTNMFAHPYHGNLYFNAARSNGLSFWESTPYVLGGSLMWEFFGEKDPPAINDVFATTFGGIALGEITHRVSNIILNDYQRGFGRFLREAAAFVVNPIKGIGRIVRGDAWRVRHDHYLYHDHLETPIDFSVSAGYRYLADDASVFRGDHNGYVTLYLGYGTSVDGERHSTPFDYFETELSFSVTANQPRVNFLRLMARIWSTPLVNKPNVTGEFGIYQHFNYYDSKPVKKDSDETPYRISEAASFGPGCIFSFGKSGAFSRIEQRVFLSGILLGGAKSDYFNVLERDYNMGSGFSLKSKTHLEFANFGRLILHAKYFRLFTWKGYSYRDLIKTDDLHYLNVQGDKGNAGLLVINPILEIDFYKQWSLSFSGSYFNRSTHYVNPDYADVESETFELKAGVTCHF